MATATELSKKITHSRNNFSHIFFGQTEIRNYTVILNQMFYEKAVSFELQRRQHSTGNHQQKRTTNSINDVRHFDDDFQFSVKSMKTINHKTSRKA
jgi:hypothetical protein